MNYLILISMASIINKPLNVTSPAFAENSFIPKKYSYNGENISPAIRISMIPSGTKSLALIMDDPDAPIGTFVHWVMWNIPVTDLIEENTSPGMQGQNGKKENKYTGPNPPGGVHHYHFKIYALDKMLDLDASSDKKALENAMQEHILASGELVGLYKK